jgi:hypothetical protein
LPATASILAGASQNFTLTFITPTLLQTTSPAETDFRAVDQVGNHQVHYRIDVTEEPPVSDGTYPANDPNVWGYKHPECLATYGKTPAQIEATPCGTNLVASNTTLSACSMTGGISFGTSNPTLDCVNVYAPVPRAIGCSGPSCIGIKIRRSTLTGAGNTNGTTATTMLAFTTTFSNPQSATGPHTALIEKSVIQNNRVGMMAGGGEMDKDIAAMETGFAIVVRNNIFRSPLWPIIPPPNNIHSELVALQEGLDGLLIENNVFDCRGTWNGGNPCNTAIFLFQPSNGSSSGNVTVRGNHMIDDESQGGGGYTFTMGSASTLAAQGNPPCTQPLHFINNVIEKNVATSSGLFNYSGFTGCPAIQNRPGSTCTGNTVNGVPTGC